MNSALDKVSLSSRSNWWNISIIAFWYFSVRIISSSLINDEPHGWFKDTILVSLTSSASTAEEIKVSSHEQDNLTDTRMPPIKQAKESDQTSTELEMGNKDERIYSNDPNMMCRIRCTICSR